LFYLTSDHPISIYLLEMLNEFVMENVAYVQDEKNQVLVSKVWLEHVSLRVCCFHELQLSVFV